MNKKILLKLVDLAVLKFSGNVDQLQAAIGMLFICHYYGWRMVYVAYNKRTINKCQEILCIKFKDSFDEMGSMSFVSEGLSNALEHSNFWKVVSGDIKIKDRKLLIDPVKAASSFHHGGKAYE